VGKVALYDTFLFTNKNQKEMLEITLSEADIFKVYFMSQEMLPNNAKLATDYNEISLYNNGRFTLGHTGVNKDYSYIIAPVCDSEWGILFKSGDVYLCKKNESY
jgi:hypothetical protein